MLKQQTLETMISTQLLKGIFILKFFALDVGGLIFTGIVYFLVNIYATIAEINGSKRDRSKPPAIWKTGG